jgi:hypothetical protein
MTPSDLAKIAAPWLKILGLEHWNIEWRYGGYRRGARARNSRYASRDAVIRIYGDWNDEVTYDIAFPLEQLIIHELLELFLADFERMEFENGADKVDYIAEKFERVLYDLKRETEEVK